MPNCCVVSMATSTRTTWFGETQSEVARSLPEANCCTCSRCFPSAFTTAPFSAWNTCWQNTISLGSLHCLKMHFANFSTLPQTKPQCRSQYYIMNQTLYTLLKCEAANHTGFDIHTIRRSNRGESVITSWQNMNCLSEIVSCWTVDYSMGCTIR